MESAMHYIPYGRQSINEDDIKAVEEVLKSDFLTTGPKIADFERKFADMQLQYQMVQQHFILRVWQQE